MKKIKSFLACACETLTRGAFSKSRTKTEIKFFETRGHVILSEFGTSDAFSTACLVGSFVVSYFQDSLSG